MTVQPGSRGTEVVPPKDLKLVSSTRLTYTIIEVITVNWLKLGIVDHHSILLLFSPFILDHLK